MNTFFSLLIGLLFPLLSYTAASNSCQAHDRLDLSNCLALSAGAKCPSPRTQFWSLFVGCDHENAALKSTLKKCVTRKKIDGAVVPVKKAQMYHILICGANDAQRSHMLQMPEIDELNKVCKDNAITPAQVLERFNNLFHLEDQAAVLSEGIRPEVSILQINIEIGPLTRASYSPRNEEAKESEHDDSSRLSESDQGKCPSESKKETIYTQNCSVVTFDTARLLIAGQISSEAISAYLNTSDIQAIMNKKDFEQIKILLEEKFPDLKAVWFIYDEQAKTESAKAIAPE